MDETQPPETAESSSQPQMPLGARLTNMFVAPGEVFEQVRQGPPTPANWIVPLALTAIVGIVYAFVVFSQPTILRKMREPQEKLYQQRVAEGKMTQQQADAVLQMTEKFMNSTLLKVFGILGALIASPIWLFLGALIIWLLGKFAFGGSSNYWQYVEMVGLASMITVLGAIIAMLLAVIYGDMSITLGPALLVSNFDPANKIHQTLSALNLMTLWYLAVLSLGLCKLSGTRFWKAAVWLFGLFFGFWATFAIGLPALIARIFPHA